jgi:hypothetical protein
MCRPLTLKRLVVKDIFFFCVRIFYVTPKKKHIETSGEYVSPLPLKVNVLLKAQRQERS